MGNRQKRRSHAVGPRNFRPGTSTSQPRRDRQLPLLLTAAALTGILALRPNFAANIPWQTIAGSAILFVSIGGAVASAMRTGDLYAATLARSSWPPKHAER